MHAQLIVIHFIHRMLDILTKSNLTTFFKHQILNYTLLISYFLQITYLNLTQEYSIYVSNFILFTHYSYVFANQTWNHYIKLFIIFVIHTIPLIIPIQLATYKQKKGRDQLYENINNVSTILIHYYSLQISYQILNYYFLSYRWMLELPILYTIYFTFIHFSFDFIHVFAVILLIISNIHSFLSAYLF